MVFWRVMPVKVLLSFLYINSKYHLHIYNN